MRYDLKLILPQRRPIIGPSAGVKLQTSRRFVSSSKPYLQGILLAVDGVLRAPGVVPAPVEVELQHLVLAAQGAAPQHGLAAAGGSRGVGLLP